MLDELVKKQFASFSQGFMLVCGGPILNLFRPEELELLIRGNDDEPDFHQLEKVTAYEGGYETNHPTIKAFWEVVHAMTLPQKKKLLQFCTGSDRIPIKGLGTIKFIIQQNGGDSEQLPTASTCFNVLLLPNYSTKEKMSTKILTAIENSEGFGLK